MRRMKQKSLNVAILQISSLSYDSAKINYYLSIARSKKCEILLLGEYVANLFFKEIEKIPLAFLNDQSSKQIQNLTKLSEIYNITIIAPIIKISNNKPYKTIFRFYGGKKDEFDQQILIDYPHWNEERFFANQIDPVKAPYSFNHNGFKVGVVCGYELHFDEIWLETTKKQLDLILVPTASTFESYPRWQTLLKMRAFNASCFVARANRLGVYEEKGYKWEFYGNSLVCNPFGEIDDALDDEEGLLIAAIDKEVVAEARKAFGFARAIKKRAKANN